jgi:16S rRNA (adenine1518-N6/adenine1519-N6)-dimethyltransferase
VSHDPRSREAREARHRVPAAPHDEVQPRRHRARKRFGQHFLEAAWANKLVDAVAAAPTDQFLEIGPGLGALTRPLAATGAAIHAIEVDRDLAATLRDTLPANVSVHEGDVLELDDAAVLPPGDGPVRVVGNLPYNLSSPILLRILALARQTGRIRDAVVMLQREVADRVLASPGTGEYGPLAVVLGLFADRTRVLSLPPGAFRPPPEVHSAVVRLVFRPPPVPVTRFDLVDRVVRTAFQQRRKTLANALRPLAAQPPAGAAGPVDVGAALAGLGIDPTRRPETLTAEEYVRLADAMAPPRPDGRR